MWHAGREASLTPDEERTAEALAVWKRYGDQAPVHVAERIGALALAGDVLGVERWQAIASAFQHVADARKQ